MQMLKHLIAVVAISACCNFTAAAELRLKSQARCSSGIVRLGDVADIFAAEAWQQEQLAAIELGPSPGLGARRYMRAREIQDALFLRGVNMSQHVLSGSERIEVIGPGEPVAAASQPTVRIDQAARDRAEREVREAVVRHLNRQTGSREPWQITVSLTDDLMPALVGAAGRLVVEGGAAPWVGRQQFTAYQDGAADAGRWKIDVEIALPPAVVAVVRGMSPGTMLHESDLVLKPVASLPQNAQPFYRIEDVVGMESASSLPAGGILNRNSVRRPIVVRRGDAVTLYARSAGLRVRTTVRAREDGGLGDLIAVESLTNREAFYARVTGIQEAEVFAAPAEASVRSAPTAATVGGFNLPQGTAR